MRTGDVVDGRYELGDVRGSGAGGVVWTAFDRKLKRTVALKRPHAVASQADRLRFRREAETAARVQHPNAISVFDTVDGDDCWLVMEYSPADGLDGVLAAGGPLTPERAARVGVQVAAALAAVHAHRIVHCDVKPGNVLVTADGCAKLTDFGISVWHEVTRTEDGAFCGTPGYTAPEVVAGRPATEASDVFSLGATLFAAVEGFPPAGAGGPGEAPAREGGQREVAPARRAGPLAPLLREMLDPCPARRPTADEARRRRGEFVGAWEPPSWPAAATPDRGPLWRRPRCRAAAVALTLAVTAAVVVVAASRSQADVFGAELVGDERTADPCALLDRAALAPMGATRLHTAKGNFNRCDVVVDVAAGKELDVEVQLLLRKRHPVQGQPFEDEDPPANSRDECHRVVMLGEEYGIQVAAKMRDPGVDLCAVADTGLDTVKRVLRRGALQRRGTAPPPDSLAHVDACGLLDRAEPAALPPADAAGRARGFGDWSCKWYSTADRVGIHLRYDQHAAMSPIRGDPVRLGDHEAYVEPDPARAECKVTVRHRPRNPSPRPTIDLVVLSARGDRPGGDHCATASRLAVVAADGLPR
ncbi:serine/threonine protein kinase [Saccharothrix algeriensis]|uniref:Serine/threonine protein kinase n=1 Tax=Saccharothrix algeriensis TaxID=173560 RepID=A0A8T8HX35_9PSEU|nr:serine/threonine protein kinase [Saccharothrix algeriensis]